MYEFEASSSAPANVPQSGQQSSLHTILQKLCVFIEHETEAIGTRRDFDFRESSEKKSRLLFELNRASRTGGVNTADEEVKVELGRLKTALKKNEARIKSHLTAIREVSDIMVGIIKNEDADGTYNNVV